MALGKTAKFYRKNKKSYAKKLKKDKEINARPEQVQKRVEANAARRRAKAAGKNVEGKDASHTKNGIVFKPSSKNRGNKTNSPGDRRARGGGKRGKRK